MLYWLRFALSLACLLALLGVATMFVDRLLRRSGSRTRNARPDTRRPPGTMERRAPLGQVPATRAVSRSPRQPGEPGADTWSRHVDTLTPTLRLLPYKPPSLSTVSTTSDGGDASTTPTSGLTADAGPYWGSNGGSCTCSGYAIPGQPVVFDSSRCPIHSRNLSPYQRAILDYESAS